MRKEQTLKLHVRESWTKWESMEVSLVLDPDYPSSLGHRFTVLRDGTEIGTLERDKVTEHHNVGRIRFDHRPRVMWRASSESWRPWRETRTDALEDMMDSNSGDVHYAGRPGWRSCSMCGYS